MWPLVILAGFVLAGLAIAFVDNARDAAQGYPRGGRAYLDNYRETVGDVEYDEIVESPNDIPEQFRFRSGRGHRRSIHATNVIEHFRRLGPGTTSNRER